MAAPPREGWIVAFMKPAVLGMGSPAGIAPPGLLIDCAAARPARATRESLVILDPK